MVITLKEQLINDIRYNEGEFLVIVEEENETMFILTDDVITQIIHNFFNDNLIGKYPDNDRDVKVIGWRFESLELSDIEAQTHFGESVQTSKKED